MRTSITRAFDGLGDTDESRERNRQVPLHLPEQPEHDRPLRLVLLELDLWASACAVRRLGAVRRRFGVRPMTRRVPQAAHPVDVSTTVRAAETELGQSAFDVLRLQEF